ncbi:PREDICTED: uncharacterized protein LOC104825398 [Tarenaya hassleriana]|uniref:uncharacterized protein LOC104825398 n=1 Tax=Tarenaya hassleriana TaxID=28532 RepID=UPI00053C9ACE|nr:PREDICTED: uncharacterized protein LOC104825398 [Tarenaya hassleriana]
MASGNGIVKFNGLNYADWSEHIQFYLGFNDMDHELLNEKPTSITDESLESDRINFDSWERSNRLCLNLMRITMAKSVKPSMPKTESAKKFMQKVKEYSQSDLADKSVGSLMSELTMKKFDWSQSIHMII